MTRPSDVPEMGSQASRAPRFCPRCRASFADVSELSPCPACGAALIPKGYCPVCEDYWLLPVETPCPKHDLPLDAIGPPRPLLDGEGKPVRWTTVAHYSDSQSADAPRIRLEAEGIPTFVEGERMGARSMYHVATGGVLLKVPDTMAHDARIILSQTWSVTAEQLGIEEDDADEEVGELHLTEAPSGSLNEATSLAFNIILFVVVGLPCLLLAYFLLRYFLGTAGRLRIARSRSIGVALNVPRTRPRSVVASPELLGSTIPLNQASQKRRRAAQPGLVLMPG